MRRHVRRRRKTPALLWLPLLSGVVAFVLPLLLVEYQRHPVESGPEPPAVPVSQSEGKPLGQTGQTLMVPQNDVAITVYFHEQGETRTVLLEQHLLGVLAAEIPDSFHLEAVKAQAVAARSYLLSKSGTGLHEGGADLCTDYTHCKAWLPEARYAEKFGAGEEAARALYATALRETAGQVLVYEDTVAQTVFHAMSGGRTESAVDVWGSEVPYLVSVPSGGEDQFDGYETTVDLSLSAYWEAMAPLNPDRELAPMVVLRRSAGDAVLRCNVGGVETAGTEVRRLLGLRSTKFWVTLNGDGVQIRVRGYGHGVGMSQYGAQVMALEGAGYQDILARYYPGCRLQQLDP
ncbi:MAG: stage II sporulation protein D [Clostridiales bacterium]|nr:stage II sporulation protein D [Clostridiales bacterium]